MIKGGKRHLEPGKDRLMTISVFQRVEDLLQQHGVEFDVMRHEPVYTSEEAAAIRGTPLASGAKALICKGDDKFVMFVMPADLKLASKSVRRLFGWRKLRFASRDEVFHLTGLERSPRLVACSACSHSAVAVWA